MILQLAHCAILQMQSSNLYSQLLERSLDSAECRARALLHETRDGVQVGSCKMMYCSVIILCRDVIYSRILVDMFAVLWRSILPQRAAQKEENSILVTLEVALKTKLARQATAGMWTSLFDYCSGRCRHNSESVVHENAYVSGEHHCFSAKSIPAGEAVEASAEDELADVSVIVGRQGFSCESTCSAAGLSCGVDKLAVLNSCAALQQYNDCKGLCISSSGPDQPSEVVSGAPEHMHPGACFYSTQVSQLSCKGYHPFTRRLCPCA